MRWLWLFRPTAPGVRAQSIQTLHSAHALAARGHRVTVCVEPSRSGVSQAEVLAFYGLHPVPTLDLRVLPAGRTAASLAFRAEILRWGAKGPGILYARSIRYAGWASRVLWRLPLFVEVHEIASLEARDQGADPSRFLAAEARVLARASGVVANAPGTLAALREVHPNLPPALAAHNATHPSRIRAPREGGEGIGYVGSVRSYKALDDLARAATLLDTPIHLVGATPEEAAPLQEIAGGRLRIEGPIPHADVPDRLARFRALVLPLSPGRFGDALTSPLKLWDYLASGVPFVGSDTPALRAAAEGMYLPAPPGDPVALASALDRLLRDEALRVDLRSRIRVRTWDERAAEIERFVAENL